MGRATGCVWCCCDRLNDVGVFPEIIALWNFAKAINLADLGYKGHDEPLRHQQSACNPAMNTHLHNCFTIIAAHPFDRFGGHLVIYKMIGTHDLMKNRASDTRSDTLNQHQQMVHSSIIILCFERLCSANPVYCLQCIRKSSY